MKKIFLLPITMLAVFALTIQASADVKTFAYPVIEDEDSTLTTIESDLPQQAETSEPVNWDESNAELEAQDKFKKSSDDPKRDANLGTKALGKVFGGFEQLRLKFNLRGTIDLLDGLGLRVGHSEDIDNAFYGNYFSRMDGWELGLKANLLEMAGLDNGLGLSIDPIVNVRLYQFFDSKLEAANPKNFYSPARIPFTADDAITKLKPGDLVSFDADLNIAYGYTKAFDKIVDWFKMNVGAGGAIMGRVRVFIFRANDNKVRLRVSALRSRPKVINARLSVFDLFDLGWGKLTELVEKALKLDELFEVELRKVDEKLWMADYTLDFNNDLVKTAYNKVFNRENRFKTMVDAANPLTTEAELQAILWEVLLPLTELSVGEQKNARPAAINNFMGSNFSNGGYFDTEGGIVGAWRGELRRVKKNNRLMQKIFDADGVQNDFYYFFPSWLKRTEKGFGLGRGKEIKLQSANIIYSTDPNYNIEKFESIGFYKEDTDKKYDNDEHQALLRHFQGVLPTSTFNDMVNYLKANDWGGFRGYRQNVRISSRYFITDKGLKLVEGARAADITKHVIAALDELDQVKNRVKRTGPRTGTRIIKCRTKKMQKLGVRTYKEDRRGRIVEDPRGDLIGSVTYDYCNEITDLAEVLAAALQPDLPPNERNEKFSSFANNRLFQKIGAGIIFDILAEGDQKLDEDVTYFELVINASGQEQPVRFSRGRIGNRPLYEIILQMQRTLNEEQPDLRLPGNRESLTERVYDATI